MGMCEVEGSYVPGSNSSGGENREAPPRIDLAHSSTFS